MNSHFHVWRADNGERYNVCTVGVVDFKLNCEHGNNSPLNRPEFVDINVIQSPSEKVSKKTSERASKKSIEKESRISTRMLNLITSDTRNSNLVCIELRCEVIML